MMFTVDFLVLMDKENYSLFFYGKMMSDKCHGLYNVI